MTIPTFKSPRAMLCASLTVLLAACGGGGSGADTAQSNPQTLSSVNANPNSNGYISPTATATTTTTPTLTPTTTTTTTTTTTATGPVTNVASCSFSAVQAAVKAATSGTTLNIPAGDCSWGTQALTVPAGVALNGAGKDVTIIRRVGSVPEETQLITFDCSNGGQAIFSNMTLVGNGNGSILDNGLALRNGCVDFKVFGSKFTNFISSAVEVNGAEKQRGVIYNNDFINNYSSTLMNLGYGVVVYGDGTWPALELGSQNAVFIEDNHMSGNRHNVASNNSSRYVFRHNTVVATDATKDYAMTDAHGLSSWPRGSRSYEIYNNAYSANLTSGLEHGAIGIRGGDGVIFNNTIASGIARAVSLELEGSSCGTYPAQDQIRSLYIWNNTGGIVSGYSDAYGIDNTCTSSIQLNRDYFRTAKAGYTPYAYPHPLRG